MNHDRVRVVLNNSVVENALTALAGKHDWWIKRRIPQSGDQPREYIYSTADGATDLHFIMDHKIGVNYILVKGPETSQVVPVLQSSLPHFSSDDILKRARDPHLGAEDRRRALYHLAIDKMGHEFDPDVFEIYKQALHDPEPFIRGSAVLGSAYLGWPELAEPIRKLAGPDEPDEVIRRDADVLSERLARMAMPG